MYDIDDFLSRLPYGGKDCNCRLAYVYFGIIICMIFTYILIMMNLFGETQLKYMDNMNKVIIELPILGGIAGWPISHFICFFVAGLLFPNCFVLVFFLGVLWEIVETVLGSFGKMANSSVEDSVGDVLYKDNWMSGRVEDIIFDVLGFLAGKMIIDAYRDNKYGNHKLYPIE